MVVRIVTDSPSDVPVEFLQRYHIRSIPAYINFGAESYLDDGVSMPRETFYNRLKTTPVLPTTAASSPGDAEKILRAALAEADHVVAVHMSGALSSMVASTRLAAKAIGEDKFTIVETGTMSMGSGWQVIAAAEKAAQGADVPEILATLQSTRQRTKLWAAMDTLEFLRRSGRVSWARAGAAALLNIKPIIMVENDVASSATRVRTFKNAMAELIKYARSQAPLERLAVLHTNNLEGAATLYNGVKDIAPPEVVTVNVASTIGVHLGPGALGFATVRKKQD